MKIDPGKADASAVRPLEVCESDEARAGRSAAIPLQRPATILPVRLCPAALPKRRPRSLSLPEARTPPSRRRAGEYWRPPGAAR